ncbi:hypothetical protein BFP72_12715 [Reichenbachiella sp. 5M10]|uniref:DUF4493 domain-containing protein n=1 Tax=Reichenbachiella sp. 5M10 TaxID=1889772 RepID=UPI000C65506E|nr:DUF4493 domain-containing protein [Reichenbachiella sp. 5M10]PIB36193.1 hypothetical protein BFP72_12715 [Reichenbachiella sp. 5M10]
MKKLFLFLLIFVVFACDQESSSPDPESIGYLELGLSLDVEESEANTRTNAVNTDDFVVMIYDANDNLVLEFDPYSSMPTSIPLATGEYYVVVHSNNLVDAGFESPYYYGRSDNFKIDKEEFTQVYVFAELANCKVAILYSENVSSTFDLYQGRVTSREATLVYAMGEIRPGYFNVNSDLEVVVYLSYSGTSGSTVEKTLSTIIENPQPKTQYNINVDATLNDGEIGINLIISEAVSEVNIDLSTGSCFDGVFVDPRDGQEYGYVTIGTQTWMAENMNAEVLNDGTPLLYGLSIRADNPAFGKYYDGYTADQICPLGWHLPSRAEFETLRDYLGADAGGKLKSVSSLWNPLNVTVPSDVCFNGEPSGRFGYQYPSDVGDYGAWWTGDYWEINPEDNYVMRLNFDDLEMNVDHMHLNTGLCVRCIQDE